MLWRFIDNTVEGVQPCRGIPFSAVEDVQYVDGYHYHCMGCSVLWIDTISTVEGIHYCGGIPFSAVEDVQYC